MACPASARSIRFQSPALNARTAIFARWVWPSSSSTIATARLDEMVTCRPWPDRAYRRPCWNWVGMRSASSIPMKPAVKVRSAIGANPVVQRLRVRGQRDELHQLVCGQSGQPTLTAADRELGQRALLADHRVDPLLDRADADESVHGHVAALPDPEGAVRC